MKKRILPLVLVLLLAASLTGCAGRTVSGEPYKMYMIVKSTTTEFWKSVFAGANAAKSEYNVDLTVLGPDTEENYEAQNEYIRQAVADGADAIVFTAGIGENDCEACEHVINGLSFMGVKIDPAKNKRGTVGIISTDDSTIKVLRIPTNEELPIARDTLEIVSKL